MIGLDTNVVVRYLEPPIATLDDCDVAPVARPLGPVFARWQMT